MRTGKKIKRNLEVALADCLTQVARHLPRSTGLRVFSAIGGTAGRLLKHERRTALENLEIAFPDAPPAAREAIARAMFKSMGMNLFEFLNLEDSPKERLLGLIERIDGEEHLDEAYGAGKGLIVLTGHIGCWELMAAYYASRGYSVNVIGRELWEKRINERMVRMRESVGYRTIDRDSGGRDVIRVLRNKGIVAALIDQHTRVNGVYVPFFNRPAHTPTGVAKLALSTGAKILPMAIYMTPSRRHIIRILPAIDPPENVEDKERETEILTRDCSLAIEELIRYDPKQWVWFHKRWREPEQREMVKRSYAAVR